MRKILLILSVFLLALASCKKENNMEYMTSVKALRYFETVKMICDNDDGKLWGENLYGPIILIDNNTRRMFSNVQDKEGLLKPKDGVFTGIYPDNELVNFAVTYGSTLFAMAPLPAREDSLWINLRCLHGLLHCYQLKKGIDTPEYNPVHMNEKQARVWVKMEWKALERAIRTSGETRSQAIRDALVFRNTRRDIYPDYSIEEDKFENYEGLATFTYMLMGHSDHNSYTVSLLEYVHRLYGTSFTQSFGFVNGSLYAYLLHEDGFDFSLLDKPAIDLGEVARERFSINLPEVSRDIAGSIAINYDIDIVVKEEAERTIRIKERLEKKTSAYTDKSVVFLVLESPSFSFEPEDVEPLDTLGDIYQRIRVSDNWGKIVVTDGGCLVSPNLQFMRVPAKGLKDEKNHITGDGWSMILKENWRLEKIENNYFVRKLVP